MRRSFALIAVAAVTGALSPLAAHAHATHPQCDWSSFGNGIAHQGSTDCSDISATNASTLTPKSLYRTRDSVTATPVVVDGTVYVGAWDGTFYAFPEQRIGYGDPSFDENGLGDLTILDPKWTFQIDDTNGVSFGRIVATASVTDVVTYGPDEQTGRLVIFAGGSTVYVLEATTGTKLASICLDPRTTGRCATADGDVEVESSPVLVPGPDGGIRIVVGNDVHNKANVGRTGVQAIDLDLADLTLTPAWKFDPEGDGPGDLDGATYRAGEVADVVTEGAGTGWGCGGVWGTPAVDLEHQIVVFGTSSCMTPTPGPDGKRGTADDTHDQVAGEKVFSVSLTDGGFRWRFAPERPWGSQTDDDFGSSAQLFHDGETLVAGIGGKDGSYYAFDAVTGALIHATHIGQSGHANNNFAIGGIIGTPAIGEVQVPSIDGAGLVARTAVFATTAISTPVGAPIDYGTPESLDTGSLSDPGRYLSVHAFDPLTGEVFWRQPLTRQSYGHPTFVAGDHPVVIVPSTAGFNVTVYEASTGVPLAALPVNGAPSSGAAVTGDSIYFGAGTRQSDAGFKISQQTGIETDAKEYLGDDLQERAAGVWGYRLAS